MRGSWLEQTAKFLMAVDFCDRCHSVFLERKAKRDAEAASAIKEMDKVMGKNG